jgi:hypothetical protein
MRIWDAEVISIPDMCMPHCNGMHNESGIIHSINRNNRTDSPYWNHPEVKRWRGHLDALKTIHDQCAARLKNHKTPLPVVGDSTEIPEPWQPIELQRELLKSKGCGCRVGQPASRPTP